MKKTKVLLVDSEDEGCDYGALLYEQSANFNIEEDFEETKKEGGEMTRSFTNDDDEEYEIRFRSFEFEEVPNDFLEFLDDHMILDEDSLKTKCYYIINNEDKNMKNTNENKGYAQVVNKQQYSKCNLWIAFLLALFAGGLGLHRFYTGRIISGLIMLFFMFTLPFITIIWWIIDVIAIASGHFRDRHGLCINAKLN